MEGDTAEDFAKDENIRAAVKDHSSSQAAAHTDAKKKKKGTDEGNMSKTVGLRKISWS